MKHKTQEQQAQDLKAREAFGDKMGNPWHWGHSQSRYMRRQQAREEARIKRKSLKRKKNDCKN